MEISNAVRDFLNEVHFAVVSTIAPDGMPHQTVMMYALEGDELVLNTPAGSVKVKHLQRDPRVSVCVEDAFRYATLQGTVLFSDDPERVDYGRLGARYQSTFSGRPNTPPDPKVARLLSQPRTTLRVAINHIHTNGLA
jgi:PPOX class probable F420-dependent enzyme